MAASREPAHDSEDLLEHAGVRVLDADEKPDAGGDRDEEVDGPRAAHVQEARLRPAAGGDAHLQQPVRIEAGELQGWDYLQVLP